MRVTEIVDYNHAQANRRDPVAMARNLGVSKQGLADLVEAGRAVLQNRL